MKVLNLMRNRNMKELLVNEEALNTWKVAIKKMKSPLYFKEDVSKLRSEDIMEVKKYITQYIEARKEPIEFTDNVNLIRSKDSNDVKKFIETYIDSMKEADFATAWDNLCVSMISQEYSISIETYLQMCIEATHDELAILKVTSPTNNFKYIEKDKKKDNGIIVYFWVKVDNKLGMYNFNGE